MLLELLHLRILLEVVNDGAVHSGHRAVLRLPSWVRQDAAIEHEAATVAGRILRNPFLEREAVDGDGEFAVGGGLRTGLRRPVDGGDGAEHRREFGQLHGNQPFVQQGADILHGRRDALEEVRLLLVIPAVAVSSQHLQLPDQYI